MIGNSFYFVWEVELMKFLQSFINPLGILLAKGFTFLGQPEPMIVVVGICYLGIDKLLGYEICVNSLCATIFNTLFKNIFVRRRPYFDHEEIKCLAVVDPDFPVDDILAQGYSFPSGHSTNSTVIPGTIYTYTKNKIALIVTIVLAVGVGISRTIVGCHYPTDILVGWLQGILTLIIMPIIYKKMDRRLMSILLIIVCGLGIFYCSSNDYFSSYGLLIGLVLCDSFDHKVTNFKNTKNIIKIILRLALSALVFLAVDSFLKLPFPYEFLDNGTLISNLVRSIRYAISAFCGFGLCPILYKYNILHLTDDKIK